VAQAGLPVAGSADPVGPPAEEAGEEEDLAEEADFIRSEATAWFI
jgi:hypothetical protein